MATIIKSFRLDKQIADLIHCESVVRGISEAKVVEEVLRSTILSREEQWQRDLVTMASDIEYQKEQIAMAEENYE